MLNIQTKCVCAQTLDTQRAVNIICSDGEIPAADWMFEEKQLTLICCNKVQIKQEEKASLILEAGLHVSDHHHVAVNNMKGDKDTAQSFICKTEQSALHSLLPEAAGSRRFEEFGPELDADL